MATAFPRRRTFHLYRRRVRHRCYRCGSKEYVTLDRARRMQLLREYIEVLRRRDRVRVSLDEDHVGVWAAHDDEER